MGSHNTECILLRQLLQNDFRKCSSEIWIAAASQFVNKKQGPSIRTVHEIFHMYEVTAVRTQFKLQALRVTNMNHQLFENTKLRRRMYGNQQTALNHHL